MGTTSVVNISQISHSPEHSDACIRALQESGIRALYAYFCVHFTQFSISTGHQTAAADLFQLEGQLLTLSLYGAAH